MADIHPNDDLPINRAVFSYIHPEKPDEWEQVTQEKHHRWLLNDGQIRMYRLGARLNPTRKWWEAMSIPPRRLNFFALADSLVFCPLICEDLARHDPVLPVVRAVGPTLLFALLMDGPQVRGRWGARHAATLAEDPGTSVLTLSSLGMVARARSPGYPPSRCVGLWKDQVFGEKELELGQGDMGILLRLRVQWDREWTADGRNDAGRAAVVSLVHHQGLG